MLRSLFRLRTTLIDQILRLTFGRDVFISYSREDALEYAQRLGTLLARERRLSVYLDQWGSTVGKKLPLRLRLALRRSGAFVLVATQAALRSKYVRREVVKFSLTKRTIIAIDAGGVLEHAIMARTASPLLTNAIRRREPLERVESRAPDPSPEVLDAIDAAATFMRQERRITATVGVLLATVLIVLTVAGVVSSLMTRRASEAAGAREADARLQVTGAELKVRSAAAKVQKAVLAADAADILAGKAAIRAANAGILEKVARANADRQSAIARALRLADESSTLMLQQPGEITHAALLAVESANRLLHLGVRSLQADTALRRVAMLLPRVLFSAPLHASHRGHVFISSDGRVVASDDGEREIEVWDVFRRSRIVIAADGVSSGDVALSADGNRIAVAFKFRGAKPAEVRIYRTDDGREIGPTIKETTQGFDFALSADGKWLATFQTHSIAVWNTETGERAPHEWKAVGGREVLDVFFSAKGRWLGIGAEGGINLWDWRTDERVDVVTTERRFTCLAFTPDEKFIAASDLTMYGIWPAAANATPVWTSQGKYVEGIVIGSDGHVAFVHQETLEVVSGFANTERRPVTKSYTKPCEGALSLDDYGRIALAGCSDGTARVYELESGREVARLQQGEERPHVVATQLGNFTSVTRTSVKLWRIDRADPVFQTSGDDGGVAFSPDSTRAATINLDTLGRQNFDEVSVWTLGSPDDPQRLFVPKVTAIAFTRDGRILAGTRDGQIGSATADGYKKLHVPRGLSEITMIAASRFEDVFAYASATDVFVCEGPVGSMKIVRLKHPDWVSSIALSDRGELVTGCADGIVRSWKWREDAEKAREFGHDSTVDAVAVTRDGRYIVSASGVIADSLFSSWSVRVWDTALAASTPLVTLPHDAPTKAVAFGPSEKFLATTTNTKTTRVWQQWMTSAPEEVVTLVGRGGRTIAFSPDGRWLASDHSLTVTDWQQERLIAAICVRLDRKALTPQEWAAHLPDEKHRDTCSSDEGTVSTRSLF
jgi:WD40 repeat protein